MKEVTQVELEELIKSKKIVIADFSAVWCGPCKSLGKILEEKVVPKLADKPDIDLVKVDIDKEKGLATALQVMGVPTMMFFFKGQRVVFQGNQGSEDRIVGMHPKIAEIIDGVIQNLESQP